MSIFLHSSGRYYYRQHIPIDLRPQFNNREDIAQSLKTRHKDEAVILATVLQKRFGVAFILIRTGFVEGDVLSSILAATRLRRRKVSPCVSCIKEPEVSPHPEPPTPPPERLLSSLFSMYVDEHKVQIS